MNDLVVIKKKQDSLIKNLTDCGKSFYDLKVSNHLSPVGWHVLHCLFIECVWIRKLFLNKTILLNKLKNNADSIDFSLAGKIIKEILNNK